MYILPVKTRSITKDLLVVPVKSRTSPTEFINSINDKTLLKYEIEDLYSKLLTSFYRLPHAIDIPTDVKAYAKKCYGFASNESFKKEFIQAASSKMDKAEKAKIDCSTIRLASKGKMKAINITGSSLDAIGDQMQSILEGDCSSIEYTSDSSQEKFPSNLSIDHHPLRTNEHILSYSNEEAEQGEEDDDEAKGEEEKEQNEEEKESDWIISDMYNISKECCALKYNTLRSQANPSTLSDIDL